MLFESRTCFFCRAALRVPHGNLPCSHQEHQPHGSSGSSSRTRAAERNIPVRLQRRGGQPGGPRDHAQAAARLRRGGGVANRRRPRRYHPGPPAPVPVERGGQGHDDPGRAERASPPGGAVLVLHPPGRQRDLQPSEAGEREGRRDGASEGGRLSLGVFFDGYV